MQNPETDARIVLAVISESDETLRFVAGHGLVDDPSVATAYQSVSHAWASARRTVDLVDDLGELLVLEGDEAVCSWRPQHLRG